MSNAVLKGHASGTGTVTLETPNTNSDRTISLPDATGTVMVSGNMPAFSVSKNNATQSFTQNTPTKVTFDTVAFDTSSNFASSRFTPIVAGYYQITAGIDVGANSNTLSRADIYTYKNGALWKVGNALYSGYTGSEIGLVASTLVYMNGTTDYLEIYTYATGTNPTIYSGSANTYFQGVLLRAA